MTVLLTQDLRLEVAVPVRESAGLRVRGATSPRGRESIYIHRCTVPAVNNAGSTTGCRDAIDEYNSFKKYFKKLLYSSIASRQPVVEPALFTAGTVHRCI